MAKNKTDTATTLLKGLGAAGIVTVAYFGARLYRQRTGKDVILPAVFISAPIGNAIMDTVIK